MATKHPRVLSVLSSLLLLALIAICTAAALGQGRWKDEAARGPYRAVLSRPVPAAGWRFKEVYTDVDVASAFFNELDKDGLVPLYVDLLMEHDLEGKALGNRILVVTRKR